MCKIHKRKNSRPFDLLFFLFLLIYFATRLVVAQGFRMQKSTLSRRPSMQKRYVFCTLKYASLALKARDVLLHKKQTKINTVIGSGGWCPKFFMVLQQNSNRKLIDIPYCITLIFVIVPRTQPLRLQI